MNADNPRMFPLICTMIAVLLLLCAAAPCVAQEVADQAEETQGAKKAESTPLDLFFGPQAGMMWLFLFAEDVEEYKLPPHWGYGGHIVKIWHFSWSRNMALEGSFLHSEGDGEVERLDGSTYTIDVIADQASAMVAYFFPGARITPYIAGGFGATYLRWTISDSNESDDEWDLTLNAGAGMDVQIIPHWTFGPTMRVTQIFPQELTKGWITGTSLLLRTSLRF
ncbi:MAG: outer membrane beta-barrel protein [Candidatus Alcyoniella australis]|nr:outer membrane beta-barrel protein [Candidatus Alcyoniella australis]